MQFNTPVLVKEFVNHLSDKWNLRVYYSEEKNSMNKYYRWHFGYPKQIIDKLLYMLETEPYWGDQHWTEVDGYYLYWLPIISNDVVINDNILQQLRQEDKNLLYLYNSCVKLLNKWINDKK